MTGCEAPRDRGATLVELLTTMVVVSFVMLALGTTVSVMTRTVTKVQATSDADTQARKATDELSRVLPFALSANTPTLVGSDWYLEVLTTSVKAGSDPTCTQWRLRGATDDLQVRTWSTLAKLPTGWTTLAAPVANDPVTQPPFAVYAADASFSTPRVAVDLWVSRPGSGPTETRAVFALRNPAAGTPVGTNVVCTEVGRP
jgi:type II secretory pathway pseudopilin PulG